MLALYVLTGARTFSGAEELTYDLQQLGRAVVVGEPTGGGAHPREGWTVHPHLEATIPVGRPVNPVSGTNWEGTGVQPDVLCLAADALDRAHALAVARLAGWRAGGLAGWRSRPTGLLRRCSTRSVRPD
ncbi:S41 family peptidase [Streptomyces atratus]|uniref:S41 family peptidase n=1 Tax=Streptomyces atratus TaxID=1893 RepID=UPI001E36BA70|nr:S41 family peptidase [Streptomyces atratus]